MTGNPEVAKEMTDTFHYLKKIHFCQAPVAYTYNPSYSGGREQEDRGSKPAQANNS
jgi:hypothetical protein